MKAFTCPHCDRVHPGLPTEWGFRQPDEVFALSYVERYLRVRSNPDLCTLDESRFFLRCVLILPFADQDGTFGWGAWAEVGRAEHDDYLALVEHHGDGSSAPLFPGLLANAIPGYRATLGVTVEVQSGGPTARPTLWMPKRSRHTLAKEQRGGLSAGRHHHLLEACGYFRETDRTATE